MTRKIFLALGLLLTVAIARADENTTMRPVIEHGNNLVDYCEGEGEMEVVHIEYDLIFKSNPQN